MARTGPVARAGAVARGRRGGQPELWVDAGLIRAAKRLLHVKSVL